MNISAESKRRRCEGADGTTPLERQVGMQIGSRLFAYDFGYKIIFLHNMIVEGSIEYQFFYYGRSTAPCISSWMGS